MEDGEVLVFFKVQGPGAVGGQLDQGSFRQRFTRRQAQRNVKDRQGHIAFQTGYFVKLAGKLLFVAEALVVRDNCGPVLIDGSAALGQRKSFVFQAIVQGLPEGAGGINSAYHFNLVFILSINSLTSLRTCCSSALSRAFRSYPSRRFRATRYSGTPKLWS